MSQMTDKLSTLLADTYALYLKTQCYHWHVKGAQFKALHELFEDQYRDLSEAVDSIAERIRMSGDIAPATFKSFQDLTHIKDGEPTKEANAMLEELAADHRLLTKEITDILELAESSHDETSVNLLSERVSAHEKMHWMLDVSRGK